MIAAMVQARVDVRSTLRVRLAVVAAALAMVAGQQPALSQGEAAAPAAGEAPTAAGDCANMQALLPALADSAYHREVTTSEPTAQAFFDQGLDQLWSAREKDALRSFQAAVQMDGSCAACYWGIALALTSGADGETSPRVQGAYQALAAARVLAKEAAPVERDLIDALLRAVGSVPAARDAAARQREYAAAMAEVAARHPDDPDVLSLWAQTLMAAGRATGADSPASDAVAALDRALVVAPDHPGARRLRASIEPAAAPSGSGTGGGT